MNCAERVIEHFGGSVTHAAAQLGISKQLLSSWKTRGAIPTVHARMVETATHRAVTKDQILYEHELRARLRRRKAA